LDACENILNEKVYAIFVNQDNMTNDAVIGISYTSGFFDVPVVGIGVRDAIFSDRVSIKDSEILFLGGGAKRTGFYTNHP
jgi:hypothetical protein